MFKRYLKNLGRAIMNKIPYDEHVSSFMSGNDSTSAADNYLKYGAVFSCIRVLAETYASCSINEYKRIDESNREETNDTGLKDILKYKPNDYTSAYNFHEMMNANINATGNAYAKIERFAGQIVSLNQLVSTNVKGSVESGRIVYELSSETGKKYTRKDIFHIPGFSMDGIFGLSPMDYFQEMIKIGMTYDQFTKNYYKNGTFPTGVFEHARRLEPEAYKRLELDIKKRYTGMTNAGVPMLLENGLTFNGITIKPIDSQLLESKEFQKREIASVYRVPLHLIGDLEKATFSNIEQQSLEFIMYTMLPHFKRGEQNINCQLLTREQRDAGYYFEFNIASLLRGDQKSMAEAFARGRQWGWLSVNDIRRMLNLNNIGSQGDIYLQPLNMKDASQQEDMMAKQLIDIKSEMLQLIDSRGQ